MSTLTPVASPKGGFPLILNTSKQDGDALKLTFPSSSAVEVNRTNLCTQPRPQAGLDWAGSSATLTLGSSDDVGVPNTTFDQTDVAKLVATGSSGYAGLPEPQGGAASAATDYTVSAYVYVADDAVSLTVRLSLLTWTVTPTLTVVTGSDAVLPSKAGWYRVSQSGTTPASTVKVSARIAYQSTTVGDTLYFTGVQVELDSKAGSYFDGASEATAAWTGTDFDSTSLLTVDPALFKALRATNSSDALVAAAT